MNWLMQVLHVDSGTELAWVIFGFSAQLMFTARFLVQWIASERARSSVMPHPYAAPPAPATARSPA